MFGLDKVASRLTGCMIEKKIIQNEDSEIYQYGIYHAMVVGFNLVTSVIIGLITGKLEVVATFLLFYASLRTYSGGFHFNNKYVCYIGSNLILLLPIFTREIVEQVLSINIELAILAVAICIILLLSPVDSKKKRLDEEEIKHHHTVAVFILGIELCVWGGLCCMELKDAAYAGYLAFLMVSVFMVVGYVINVLNHDI